MGVVWSARDTLLQRDVAVKEVLFPAAIQGTERSAMQARVLREARAAARLSHPGVVTVFDVVQQEDQTYIVMERVDAPSLADLVESRGPLSPTRAAALGVQILRALRSAHRSGVIHRDVKPGNVMVSADGHVKLTDFGVASVKDEATITTTGQVFGSPAYMAPEQARGLPVGPEADLWGLGATLYFALEGRPPFEKGQPIPTLTAVLQEDPLPLRGGGSLGPLVLTLLNKRPEMRPSAAMVERLLDEAAGGGDGLGAPEDEPHPAMRLLETWTSPGTQGSETPRTSPKPDGRRPLAPWGLLVGSGLVLILVLGILGLSRLGSGNEESPLAASPSDPASAEPAATRPSASRTPSASPSRSPTPSPSPSPTPTPAPAPSPTPTPPASASPTSAGTFVPQGWTPYRHPTIGYRIAHPSGWEVVQVDANRTDFREPRSSTYLRVGFTDVPKPSAQQAWEEYAPQFAATHENYREIQITPTTYRGFEASVWEFTYTVGEVQLHAVDLGFVTGPDAFALNFQTRAEDWEASQGIFELFKRTFQPPA